MEHRNSFEVQFSALNRKDKLDYAKGFINGIESEHQRLKNTVSHYFRLVTKNKSSSIQQHRHNEGILEKFQKMDAQITRGKAAHLRDFMYVDLENITILTPDMENGIKDFVFALENNDFKMLHDISGYHDSFKNVVYSINKDIVNDFQKYKDYLNNHHDNEQEKLKNKYSDLFPNRKKRRPN